MQRSAAGNVVVARRKGVRPPITLNSAQMLIGGAMLLIALPVEGLPRMNLPTVFDGQLL